MNINDMLTNPEFADLISEFTNKMIARSKQEQAEKAKNYKILNQSAYRGQILFTGSSLMEQFPICELAHNHGINKTIYNRGIGGYTTDDFLAEIDTVLFDLEPSKIFINIGTNDMNVRQDGKDWNEHLLNNYEAILSQIKTRLPKTEVYMMAYYPVNATVADKEIAAHMLQVRTNENLMKVNLQMKTLSEKFGYHFINANEGLYDKAGNLKAELTKEGVHMFANAYEIVFHNLKKYI